MYKSSMKALQVLFCAVLMFEFSGCGTLMYPDRRGQRSGRIDVGVAVLDGIGLLFFVVPGVIAFAVDFSNGTIYLPGTARSSLDLKNIKQVKFDAKHSSFAAIERVIKEQTGCTVTFDEADMRITKLGSMDDMMTHFAMISSPSTDNRLSLIRPEER